MTGFVSEVVKRPETSVTVPANSLPVGQYEVLAAVTFGDAGWVRRCWRRRDAVRRRPDQRGRGFVWRPDGAGRRLHARRHDRSGVAAP
jgi:hypothetical protein